ncbi:unnamed protein product [Nesidiocoris tenuis]|uniref:Uncharacterized protein n=1 Tax=Nesidiocoris tenuis TaxID=355587 RepID=A0A6H5GUF2_9HEMI|nr:unnamed protein product [Nesidiocoris tenuis]
MEKAKEQEGGQGGGGRGQRGGSSQGGGRGQGGGQRGGQGEKIEKEGEAAKATIKFTANN